MSIGKVIKAEEKILREGACPDCGETEFLEGPHAGPSINVMCANRDCRARFIICGPATPERISKGKCLNVTLGLKGKGDEKEV